MRSANKAEYKKKIKQILYKAYFSEYMKEKETKSKLNQLEYNSLTIQPYLTEKVLT